MVRAGKDSIHLAEHVSVEGKPGKVGGQNTPCLAGQGGARLCRNWEP